LRRTFERYGFNSEGGPQIKSETVTKEEIRRCPVCGVYLNKGEGFTCPKCHRSPLCNDHKFKGKRVCTSCVFDLKSRELREMKDQENGIGSFLRLAQFVFLLCAVFFISNKMGLFDTVDFLRESLITDYVIYSMGAASIAAYVVFYLLLLNQRSKIGEAEALMNTIKYRRLV
jgi:hypothetical protein